VAICRSPAHLVFIEKNLMEMVKARNMLPGWSPLPKPQHLAAFEKANQQLISSSASRPSTTPPPPRAAPAAACSVVVGAASSGATGAGIASFGSVSL
jgi:hypothetical protein